MLQIRKSLAAVAAVVAVAVSLTSCTSSTDSVQTGSVGYSSVDYGLRPACRDGFGNDRPCSY
ncbi:MULTISPECIES: hypothetical protein [Rhizobium]|uniref:hypothetical protein n=1 Tax=Rhizobium TaxID=379 RepID=UPI000BBDE81A|nr:MULTISPECIES: hypothetical protein [Rhizobium]PCK85086.1 hypothetical protein CPT32_20630 [Rhizobium sophoriradicis]PDV87070.1 hypothetical protein CO652_17345 [Rhizobium sp. H4]